MYWINTMPREAMDRKGHASFPEDFARLRPGETFTAWRVRRGWEVETTLDGKALIERLMELQEREPLLDGACPQPAAQSLDGILPAP